MALLSLCVCQSHQDINGLFSYHFSLSHHVLKSADCESVAPWPADIDLASKWTVSSEMANDCQLPHKNDNVSFEHKSLVFQRIFTKHKPFDSPWNVLQNVFWVCEDRRERLAANRTETGVGTRRVTWWHQNDFHWFATNVLPKSFRTHKIFDRVFQELSVDVFTHWIWSKQSKLRSWQVERNFNVKTRTNSKSNWKLLCFNSRIKWNKMKNQSSEHWAIGSSRSAPFWKRPTAQPTVKVRPCTSIPVHVKVNVIVRFVMDRNDL